MELLTKGKLSDYVRVTPRTVESCNDNPLGLPDTIDEPLFKTDAYLSNLRPFLIILIIRNTIFKSLYRRHQIKDVECRP